MVVSDSFSLKANEGIKAAEALTIQSARKGKRTEAVVPGSPSGGGPNRGRTPSTFPRVTVNNRRDMTEVRKVLFDDVDEGAGGVGQLRGPQSADEDTIAEDKFAARSHYKNIENDIEKQLAEQEEQSRAQLADMAREYDRLMKNARERNQSPSHQNQSPRGNASPRGVRAASAQATVIRESPRHAVSSPRHRVAPSAPTGIVGAEQRSHGTSSPRGHVAATISPRAQTVGPQSPLTHSGTSPHRANSSDVVVREEPSINNGGNVDPETMITHEIFNYLMQQGTSIEDITEADIRKAINIVLTRGQQQEEEQLAHSDDNMSLITHVDQVSVGVPERIRSLRDAQTTHEAAATHVATEDDIEQEETLRLEAAHSVDEVRVLQDELLELQDQMTEMRAMAEALGIDLPEYPGGMVPGEKFGAVDAELNSEETDSDDEDYQEDDCDNVDGDEAPEAGIYPHDADATDDDEGASTDAQPHMTHDTLAELRNELSKQKQLKLELEQREMRLSDEARLAKLISSIDADATEAESRREEEDMPPVEEIPAIVSTDDIYKEVSMFILQNEKRPSFVVNFFRALRGMSSDYECERLLAATEDIKRFCSIHPELKGTASPPPSASRNPQPRVAQNLHSNPTGSNAPSTTSNAYYQDVVKSPSNAGTSRFQEAGRSGVKSVANGTTSPDLATNEDLMRALDLIKAYPGSGPDDAPVARDSRDALSVKQEDLYELIRLNDRMKQRVNHLQSEETKSHQDVNGIAKMVRELSLASEFP